MLRTTACVLFSLLVTISCRNESAPEKKSVPAPPVEAARPAPPSPPVCTPAPNRLCPVDEGANDASFAAFRQELLASVERRDREALLALVDPKIRTSFGEGGGVATFDKQWDLQSPRSELWNELKTILTSGGSFRGDSFWAPYVYASWPESVDAFAHVAAMRADVPVRHEPDLNASAVTSVSWEILELRGAPDRDGWLAVRTARGEEGWVQKQDARSPIGYRAGFSRRSGKWRMEALVAGD